MSFSSRKRSFWLVAAVALAAPFLWQASGAEAGDCERVFGKEDAPDAPIALHVSFSEGNPEQGLRLRVELKNTGDEPHILSVCDSMTLCCVKKLHPLIACEDTAMGLQDLCKNAKPTSHEVFLPAKAAFAFDAAIPPKWLPEAVLSGKSTVKIQFCYELGDGKTVHSNAIEVALR